LPLQDQLRELFNLDKQVRGMRTRLDAALTRTGAQAQKRQQLQRQRDELVGQLKLTQAKTSALEGQLAEMDQRIEKARTQMNSVRSNKEYSALLLEVNTLKAEKGKVEEQALEHMQKVDTIKAQVAEVEAKIAEREKLQTQSQGEVDAARTEVGEKLDELTAQRDAAAAELPPEVLKLFNRMADNHDGEAMAEVEEQSRKHREYICGGCYMELPYERVNVVMSRPNELVTCPNCGRILYIGQELKAAIGTKA
jgi:predicted  nucleic acid-binding Zn-ribbon protein